MAGLETLGPSTDEAAGATGPPPSAVSSRVATPRYREPVVRVAREPADRADDGETTDPLELSFRRDEQRARDVTEITLRSNVYHVTVALASLARFNEDREASVSAGLELRGPAVEELRVRPAYRTPARTEVEGL
eukprot:3546454-Alexandrium_andersonii.AAC.1